MNLQKQSLVNSLTPFSLPSAQSLGKRRPRFQRQKSNNKCECHSNSKNKSSCDGFSMSHFYAKKSFAKPSTPLKARQNEPFSESMATNSMDFGQSGKKNLDSTRIIQNKNDSQEKNQIHKIDYSQVLVQGFLFNNDSPDDNKKNTEAMMKKAIFYREKCQKYETLVKDIRAEKSTLQIQAKIFCQEIEKLKCQILLLKQIIDDYISQDSETVTQTKKFQNKNLIMKLKQQYQRFRQEQKFSCQSYEKKYLKVNDQLEQVKNENEQLRQDLARQNELFNLKVKMMQQKQEFLQKTLSFTKNTLNQLQKDYEDKQGQILESKRRTEIIAYKNREIQTLKSKYQNIVKMINGEKRRAETYKVQKQTSQKLAIPSSSKNLHSLEVKSIVYNHQQNGKISFTIKTNVQKQKIIQSLIEKEINNKKMMHKENYQISEVKKKTNSKRLSMHQKIDAQNIMKNLKDDSKLRQSNLDLTLISSNSLELSPQKSQN